MDSQNFLAFSSVLWYYTYAEADDAFHPLPFKIQEDNTAIFNFLYRYFNMKQKGLEKWLISAM